MTTLFNLFCPLLSIFSVKAAILGLALSTILTIGIMAKVLSVNSTSVLLKSGALGLFPLSGTAIGFMLSGFFMLAMLNLISLVCYSYPVTTTLGWNLALALTLWLSSILIMTTKSCLFGTFLPANSPWYLAPFLSLVEFISIVVRPITLCFRLLANMSAGHVLLTLICKMGFGLWLLGTLFGLLELMVSFVQAFVFLMLTTVYLEEAFSH